ncbi:MAG: UDP-N-acetylglucosamine--N-acetylmuramyl-(pentapeptide) pyrophosphoryl-undecaprenol N-acetylglucosamine transferase, partial [Candidatus Dormibacteraeota bacterium]|nr:UDP-N-acetylglucosamine--N-acetylmuramyl-(pentapeptide) pyrophosphoryl-undecaprenol N-acetylglucosamine transferase [Candidatus Dormibacteraeota bacterium]
MRTLIAGGGTGGHLTPVLAVAQELRRTDPGGDVLIVGRRGGVAENLVGRAGFTLRTLHISGLDISNARSVFRFAARSPAAVLASRRLIADFGADVVVGGAGYVSVPVVVAASLLRVPVVLLEQNALPGRATRFLARRARVVATAFAETASHLKGVRVVQTGNPIREEVLAQLPRPLADRPRSLLVMGGSQGARRINRAVAGCVADLLDAHPDLTVVHQTGARDIAEMEGARRRLAPALQARYEVTAFIDDVGAALNRADLVLMRAGGSSLAECTAFGRPMILVPYPHAGGHQRFNAEPYAAAGAARVVADADCEPGRVRRELSAL